MSDTVMRGFWGARPLGDITVMESDAVPQGKQILTQGRRAVYVGLIGDPIEDAVFNGVVLSPQDYKKFKAATEGLP